MSRKKWMPMWVVPVLIAMSIVTVWLRLSIVRTTYAINHSNREVRELQQARELMEFKVTALRSPRNLEALAKSKFGLGTPRADQVIHLGGRNAP